MAFEFAPRNPTWRPSRHPGSGKEYSITPSRATEVQHGPRWHPSRPRDTYHGARVGRLGPSWGGLGAALGRLGAVGRKSKNAGFIFRKKLPCFVFSQSSVPARNSEADEAGETDEPETVSATAAPTSPCHRTGGKDFGSLLRDAVQA